MLIDLPQPVTAGGATFTKLEIRSLTLDGTGSVDHVAVSFCLVAPQPEGEPKKAPVQTCRSGVAAAAAAAASTPAQVAALLEPAIAAALQAAGK